MSCVFKRLQLSSGYVLAAPWGLILYGCLQEGRVQVRIRLRVSLDHGRQLRHVLVGTAYILYTG